MHHKVVMKGEYAMPILSGKSAKSAKSSKSGKAGKAGSAKGKKSIPVRKRPGIDLVEDDETVEERSDGTKAETVASLAEPMQGDVVSPALISVLIVPRIAGEELNPLKGFLKYYSITGIYIGSIVSKTSFMHKKGGILL